MSVVLSAVHGFLLVLLVCSTSAQDIPTAVFELTPIASAAPQSTSFALVDDKSCDASVVAIVYELYSKNTMVFQTCVSEGQYKIFPFSGTHPTTQQIGDMARSLACRAIFTSILLAGIPECALSNFPIRAAAETLLKIGVDIDKYPKLTNVVPSTDRFIEMMHWRRDVNLAQAVGLPCDSESMLYAEYSTNLHEITSSGLVRLTADKKVQYRSTIDGSFSQEQIVTMPNMPGLHGSGSDSKQTTVYAAEPITVKSSKSSDTVVTKAELTSNVKQTETEKSDAASTSGGTQINSKQTQVHVLTLVALSAILMLA